MTNTTNSTTKPKTPRKPRKVVPKITVENVTLIKAKLGVTTKQVTAAFPHKGYGYYDSPTSLGDVTVEVNNDVVLINGNALDQDNGVAVSKKTLIQLAEKLKTIDTTKSFHEGYAMGLADGQADGQDKDG